MNMMIGGKIPFNPNESRRVVLSFIPKNITIPPRTALTYQGTISNRLQPWLIFSHRYDDADGILDQEAIPTHKSNSPSHFWSLIFIPQALSPGDLTFGTKNQLEVQVCFI